MTIADIINEVTRPYEVKAMADVTLKEAHMLQARAEAIRDLALNERDPKKVIEHNAEVSLITRMMYVLNEITDETVAEAERLGMTK